MLHGVAGVNLGKVFLVFQFLLGCYLMFCLPPRHNQAQLSIPFRMLPRDRFPTGAARCCLLSIPFRMLHEIERLLEETKRVDGFQFLLGCYSLSLSCAHLRELYLSIPFRMLLCRVTTSRSITNWLSIPFRMLLFFSAARPVLA